MKIGELFVNLGIKGNEKTLGALSSTKNAMGEIASTSLEAKAAIVGAMYALERLVAESGATGTSLTNLNALTGVSTQVLQKWEWAMKQTGGTAQEMDGIFKNLQKTMALTDFGKGVPEGFALLAQAAGGIDYKQKNNSEYMAGKMRDAIQNMGRLLPKERQGLTNFLAQTMGLTDNFVAGSIRGFFDQANLNKAPTYSPTEVKALADADRAWGNLAIHIEMAVGHFNALHGGQLVHDITRITDSVLKLSKALLELSDKIHVFPGISALMNHTAEQVQATSDFVANPTAKTGKNFAEINSPIFAIGESLLNVVKAYEAYLERGPRTSSSDTVVQQTNNFHAHPDAPKETANQLKHQLKKATSSDPNKQRVN